MARTGRPKAENPKNFVHTIRLDEKTERQLREYCEKRRISKGEALREGLNLLLAQKKQGVSQP